MSCLHRFNNILTLIWGIVIIVELKLKRPWKCWILCVRLELAQLPQFAFLFKLEKEKKKSQFTQNSPYHCLDRRWSRTKLLCVAADEVRHLARVSLFCSIQVRVLSVNPGLQQTRDKAHTLTAHRCVPGLHTGLCNRWTQRWEKQAPVSCYLFYLSSFLMLKPPVWLQTKLHQETPTAHMTAWVRCVWQSFGATAWCHTLICRALQKHTRACRCCCCCWG